MYEKERGTTVYNSTRSKSWTGYVGIMYPSDYGYAASSSYSDSINLGSYSNTTCTSNNWLKKGIAEWTLAPNSGYSDLAFRVYSSGSLNSGNVYNTSGVRPVLYLKGNVQITGGDGSQAKPYQLQIT